MKTLYLHNYKGFTNAFIPFLDVNFLVGENSTGKTALLNLMNILADMKFWMSADFNNETVELGYFNEIVNQRGKRSTFEIGIEYDEKSFDKNDSKYVWIKFKDKDNIPSISEYRYIDGNRIVNVKIGTRCVDYYVEKYRNESFGQWIKNSSSPINSDKRRINYPKPDFHFGAIRMLVSADLMAHDSTEVSLRDFYLSHINDRLIWLSPIRAKAQRTYEAYKSTFTSEGSHTPILLKKILSNSNPDKSTAIKAALDDFGLSSGLFDTIEINNLGDKKGSPFSINVSYDTLPIRITNVGYGVSQILPIIVEILTSTNDTIAIQQPEVHLHPKAQAAFGDLVYKSASENKNAFYIETHSDFTINRFRYNLYKSDNPRKPTSQVLFFERTKHGIKVTPLKFNGKGQYPEDTPTSYSHFFIDEELKMLEF